MSLRPTKFLATMCATDANRAAASVRSRVHTRGFGRQDIC